MKNHNKIREKIDKACKIVVYTGAFCHINIAKVLYRY